MAIKDLAELIKKFTQKDKFKPTTVQVIRAAKNPPVPAQNEDISVPSEGERIHFLNTGRSDCILLQSESKFALVDCGDAEHAKHTASYLKETAGGKINLDFIAITHLHSGHVGGLETLLDDGDITIGKIYLKPFISPNLAQWDKCLHDGDALYKSLSEKAQSMNIPVIGWIYLLYLAFRKDTTLRRNFARAYLFYKLVFLLISLVILGILVYIGMGLLENLLAYMEML